MPRACRVTVPDHQLSLAIGNKGTTRAWLRA
jgi:transcription antitermination factor NusA-like protein